MWRRSVWFTSVIFLILCFPLFPLDGPLPNVIQHVEVPIINNKECEEMYQRAGYIEHIPNIFVCAGLAKGTKDSCEVRSETMERALGCFECFFYNFSHPF